MKGQFPRTPRQALWLLRNRYRRSPYALLLSYPKTGRTWLRRMIGLVLLDMYARPSFSVVTDEHELQRLTCHLRLPRLCVTHCESDFTANTPAARFQLPEYFFSASRRLFLTRNIGDTLISAYHQTRFREDIFHGDLGAFIRDDRYGAVKFAQFCRLVERSGLDQRIVRYEDCRRDTKRELRRVLAYLRLGRPSEAILDRAIERCEFERMKRAEVRGELKGYRFSEGEVDPDPRRRKVRDGALGAYVAHMSPDQLCYLEKVVQRTGCKSVYLWEKSGCRAAVGDF